MKPTKRQKRSILIILMIVIGTLLNVAAQKLGWNVLGSSTNNIVASIPAGMYRVTSFEDGDTIVVDMNGIQERVRFIGVDTPEVKDPRKPVQCFGKAASEYTKGLIGSSPVRLEADPENTNRDRYNRLLRYAYLPNGTLVNAEIIKSGYGFAYTSFPFTKKYEFKRYEEEARTSNKGLWGNCQTGIDERGFRTINPET